MTVFCRADNLCRFQLWKAGQPKASCFPHRMSVLIRLNNLIGLSVAVRHDADRILYGYPLAVSQRKVHEENTGFLLPEVFLLVWKPSCPGDCEVGAWGMSDDQIPLANLCVCVYQRSRKNSFRSEGGEHPLVYAILDALHCIPGCHRKTP